MPRTRHFPSSLLLVALSGLSVVAFTAACDDDTRAPAGPDVAATDTGTPDTAPEDVAVVDTLTLVSVSPGEGHTIGLEEVQITGFELGGVTQVLFGDAPALDVFVVSDRLIVCLTPPQARGVVDVSVLDDLGRKATLARAFNYRDPVSITSIEPAQGHWLGGEAVTIYGAGFVAGSVVLIGGRASPSVEVVDGYTINLVTPDGIPGPADVHVSSADGVARARGGFVYTGDTLPPADGVRIDDVTPSRGPAAGGTAITIDGFGFRAGMVVRVGALPALEVVIESDRIRARTPPGSPGLADVRIFASGEMASAEGAFTFEADPAVWAVDPPSGAVAGGTIVRVRGHGFPTSGAEVLFGDAEADILAVDPDGAIRVKTPPGDVGQVPVRVRGGGVDVQHPRGFVYFDPAANPGTWGEPIDGSLNVTVIEAGSGARVPSAFVLVGDTLTSTHRGYTDINGQITFSGDDLVGEQRVSASTPGKQIFQLGGFDAENVTLAIERIPTCQDLADIPCDILVEPPPSATLSATIIGSNKGPTIPFGECRDWPDAPNGLCEPCSVDDDCLAVGGGDDDVVSGGIGGFGPPRCTELGGEGSFCSSGCTNDADCPATFVCLDPSGTDEDRRCVPPPGEWAAYCDITEPSMDSDQVIAYPGVVVNDNRTVQFTTRLGNYALFCWGGVIVRTEFRPQYLGVTRHLGAFIDGEVVTAEVKLDIPLDEHVTIDVDRPTLGPVSDERTLLRTIMNLGGDGVLEFPPQRAFGQRRFHLTVPGELDGVLYDATWDLFVQVEVPSLNGGSAALEPGLKDLNPVIDYLWDEEAWAPMIGFDETVHAMTVVHGASGGGNGTEALILVGEGGLVARSFNGTWAQQQGGTDRDLHAVAAAPEADAGGVQRAILGGVGGFVAHWDGLRWVAQTSGVVATIEGIAFADATTAWAVAGPDLLRWDGVAWTIAYTSTVGLHAVAADATRVWAVGDDGVIVTGEAGVFAENGTGFGALRALWRAPDGALTAVGDGGTILAAADGATFVQVASGTDQDLVTVWGRASDDVWAGGVRATIVHWDGTSWIDQTPSESRGTVRAIGGVAGGEVYALGSHELVLGPLLGIPEELSPAPGSTLGDSLTWTSRAGILPHFTVLDIGNQIGPCSACGFMFMLPYGEWLTVLDGDLFTATYPNFDQVQGALGLSWGVKGIGIYRVRTDDTFDFDHTASTGFYGGNWRAWSWRTEAWFR